MARPSKSADLIDAGLELFDTRPYTEITLDDVAEKAGVTRGLLLYYFKNREGFFLEVARTFVDQAIAYFPPELEPGEEGWLENEVDCFLQLTNDHYLLTEATSVHMVGIDGVREVVNKINTFTAERACKFLGIGTDNQLLLGALRAWGRSCVDLALHGIPVDFVTNDQLKRIMIAQFYAIVDVVLAEPQLGS